MASAWRSVSKRAMTNFVNDRDRHGDWGREMAIDLDPGMGG